MRDRSSATYKNQGDLQSIVNPIFTPNWLMALMKSPFFVATFSVALSLEILSVPCLATQKQVVSQQETLGQKITTESQVSQTVRPQQSIGSPPSTGNAGQRYRPRKPIGSPPITGNAGRRNGSCVSSSEKGLTALTPISHVGLTVSEYPTFLGYIPKSTAKAGEFILMNQNNRVIYRTNFAIPSQPGIISISLPAETLPPLEVDKMYQWYLVLVCNPEDRSDNEISATAWIQRTQPSQALTNQLQAATPRTRPDVYAADGVWYEALASLVELRREQPDNPTIFSDWEELLKSVGLQEFIQEPLVECCQIKN